jgi:hypothetical protein
LIQSLNEDEKLISLIQTTVNPENLVRSIRRLTSLRVTIIIIEDIHLINNESYCDMNSLIEALSEDNISLLCATRPAVVKIMGSLEPYLMERIELKGLNLIEIDEFCKELFSHDISEDVIKILSDSTKGNPLVLRSVMRGVIQRNAIKGTGSGKWEFEDHFEQSVYKSAITFGEGLLASLTDSEKKIASDIAVLGESFAPQSAKFISDCTDEVLKNLIFKGIIVESNTAVLPLMNLLPYQIGLSESTNTITIKSTFPLVFTHTLIHKTLLDINSIESEKIIYLIVEKLPFYSITLYEVLHKNNDQISISYDVWFKYLECSFKVGMLLQSFFEWEYIDVIFKAHSKLFNFMKFDLETSYREGIKLKLNNLKLKLKDQGSKTRIEELKSIKNEINKFPNNKLFLHFTTLLQIEEMSCLAALGDKEKSLGLMTTIDATYNSNPELKNQTGYNRYLQMKHISGIWLNTNFDYVLRDTFKRQQDLFNDSSMPDLNRNHARMCFYMQSFDFFSTKNESIEIEKRFSEFHLYFNNNFSEYMKYTFYSLIGKLQMYKNYFQKEFEAFNQNKLSNDQYELILNYYDKLILTGELNSKSFQPVIDILKQNDSILKKSYTNSAVKNYCLYSITYSDIDLVNLIIELFEVKPTDFIVKLFIELTNGKLATGIKFNELEVEAYKYVYQLYLLVCNVEKINNLNEIIECAKLMLKTEIVRIDQPQVRYVGVMLLEHLFVIYPELKKELKVPIEKGLIDILEWMQDSELLSRAMKYLVKRFGNYFQPKNLEKWKVINDQLSSLQFPDEISKNNKNSNELEFTISLIGKVEVTNNRTNTLSRIQGYRAKVILGVISANYITGNKMNRDQFIQLASERGFDPKRGSEILKNTIHRLHELVGSNIIFNKRGEPPCLDNSKVICDIVVLNELRKESKVALKNNDYVLSGKSLCKLLDLIGHNVLFPGIYEEYFEELRNKLENEIRHLIIRVSSELIKMQDFQQAEDILNKALTMIPDDNEFIDLIDSLKVSI